MEQYLQYIQTQNKDVLTKIQYKFLSDEAITSGSDYDLAGKPLEGYRIKERRRFGQNYYKRRLLSTKNAVKRKFSFNWKRIANKFRRLYRKAKSAVTLKQPYTFSPNSSMKMLWDLLCLLLVIYEMITVPLIIGFEIEISQLFSRISSTIFMFDILVNFNTGVFLEGKLNMNRKDILKEYMRFWFWLDFVSAFPYDIIMDESSSLVHSAKLIRLLKFLRFVKVLKLIRLAKLKKIIDKFDELLSMRPRVAAIINFCKLFFFVLYFAHVLGCIFHYIAYQESSDHSWLGDIYFSDWTVRYVNSLYWGIATMTTVGYGDISPQTPQERFIGILLLLIACGGFAFTMNSIGFALQEIDGQNKLKKEKIKGANKLMKKVGISNHLQNRIRRYIHFVMDSKSLVLQDITNQVQNDLAHNLRKCINGKLLGYCNILLKNTSQQFLIEIVMPNMKERIYNPEEVIFDEFDFQQNYDIFIIKFGLVDIFFKKTGVVIDQKRKNQYFGEISFYSNLPRSASARSANFSSVFRIFQSQFQKSLKEFQYSSQASTCPNLDLEQYYSIRNKIVFHKDYGSIGVRCYVCSMDDHISRDCEKLHFNVSATHYIKFLKLFDKLHQSAYFRRDRIDFNARKCISQIKQAQKRFETSKLINLKFKRKNYLEDLLNSYNLIEEEMQENQNPEYQICNLKRKSKIKSIRNLNGKLTKKYTRMITYTSISEKYIEGFSQKLNDLLLKARKKEMEEKFKQLQFSSISNFDQIQEFTHFQPEGNFSIVMSQYLIAQEKGFPKLMDVDTLFGIEEFQNYSQHYYQYLEIDTEIKNRKNFVEMNFEQLRLLNMNRREKKKEKVIKEANQQIKKSLIQLKVYQAMNLSFRNLFVN
ncbi:unnamed protein product (macronuclear) [Paramecium tetraurelia]|uniref:Cyclic nucleotide-binding domain-containing protein n=1 Tax=Paramecium tetraurelia TaxID=5888 RepID=A0DBG0_PARTE|nr:uncharacterized protein GSPATT00015272001 [Paramecium tetraurelia]CAK80377.1 unnamed protein product [Paramecium tetraurelia]|eukprot:XP_001447774.1 hypothetical protein (macronuclear) [Paramecium tetraurelia strain d4-2]